MNNLKNDKSKAELVPILTFAVISDIHAQIDRLKIALLDLANINKNYDVLILNGDIVDKGHAEEYDQVSSLLEEQNMILPKKIIKNIGNHEFYNNNEPNEWPLNDILLTRYLNFAERENVYYDLWIKGYHFISLGSETTYNKQVDPSSERANISEKQLLWLEKKIACKYTKKKPIFIFLHQPLDDTVIFTRKYHRFNVNKDQEIKQIISKYPNTIYFCSHSHHTLTEAGNFYKNSIGALFVDTSSIVNPVSLIDGTRTTSKKKFESSEGIYVEVYKHKILIKGRDFFNKKWIITHVVHED